MFSVSTFYFSRVLGRKIFSGDRKPIGKLQDFIVDMSFIRPKVIGARIKADGEYRILDFSSFTVSKQQGQYEFLCMQMKDLELPKESTVMFLAKHILDRQIVDVHGRKVVRVNDLRMAVLANGVYVVAVDVGIEGLLRRLGIAKPVKQLLKPLDLNIPSQLILWDEVARVDFSHAGIKLSKDYTKLSTLHPSDLADIIEDLDHNTQVAIFNSLDEEKAADVLEELEPEAQVNLLESLSVEKAADMLEKMPADEVADILDEMEEDKAEELLSEMENEASQEVRELMEYPENEVGSLMSTDYISFNENLTVGETIRELRRLKPESDTIYYLYVLDDDEKLVATVSLRDIVVSEPETRLNQIMNKNVVYVYDYDKIDSIAEILTKYSLLAVPVVDGDMVMVGMVLIDDVVHNLLKSRRKRA